METGIDRTPLGIVASDCQSTAKLFDILERADVCRIAMCYDNVPYIVTMNFGMWTPKDGGFPSLYFHSSHEGKKIHILRRNNLVCFQADIEHEFFLHTVSCGCSMKYQSVVGMGKMHFIHDFSEKQAGLQAIMAHYTKKSEHVFKEEMVHRTMVMRLDVEEISGRGLAT